MAVKTPDLKKEAQGEGQEEAEKKSLW